MDAGNLDYYQILKISRDASAEEIRVAYFEAARVLHPDVNPSPKAREEFMAIQQAYETLSNALKKEKYDDTLPKLPLAGEVAINVRYSRSAIPEIQEAQLLYALVEIVCTAKVDPDKKLPVHLCLVLDCSTSMKGDRLEMVKSNALQLLRKLSPQDYFSVVTFSDRADVVVAHARTTDLPRIEQRIGLLKTGGGTEIFHGLEAGISQIKYPGNGYEILRHLILLTDGHTYGDEDDCLELARQAEKEGILINSLGIGSDWNDIFLDQLSGLTGGNAVYVSSLVDLEGFLEEKVTAVNNTFARSINFHFTNDPNRYIRYAFRIDPETGPLEITTPMLLGGLQFNRHVSILYEFMIPKIEKHANRLVLATGELKFLIPSEPGIVRYPLVLERPLVKEIEPENPPLVIIEAMARLTLYRLQEKARNEVSAGDLQSATRHLQYLATHLLSSGNRELAHTVLVEAEHIKQSRQFSREGDKRIKYATRALLLPVGMESKTI